MGRYLWCFVVHNLIRGETRTNTDVASDRYGESTCLVCGTVFGIQPTDTEFMTEGAVMEDGE